MREEIKISDTIPAQTRRLHISPFNPLLLPIILPPPVLRYATDISYHEIQTFPERNYGYVTLPLMDADKITKKLNGSILKGSKMKVGEARPEKSKRKRQKAEEEEEEGKAQRKKARKSKPKEKSKEEGVLPGVELPKERKVKRGWTEVEAGSKSKEGKDKKGKKTKTKSSRTNEPELLFKTTLPPNAAPVTEPSSKKEKAEKHKKGRKDREVVVHEFANTTKQPTFLRDDQAAGKPNGTTEFVDGKGWVDPNGEVLEAEPKSIKKSRKGRSKETQPVKAPTPKPPAIAVSKPKPAQKEDPADDQISSSGTSSPSSSSSSDSESSPRLNRLSITRSSATPPRLTTTSPPPPSPPQPHPLETLFKRPQPPTSTPSLNRKPNLEVSTSFSFFDDNDPGASTAVLAPRTPATQLDIRNRRQRSAAPTPDTAMPGKSFWSGPGGRRSESLEAGDVSDGDLPIWREGKGVNGGGNDVIKEEGKKEESAFAKEFWEKRGERNRAVKRRVREAKKERRQRENKKDRA